MAFDCKGRSSNFDPEGPDQLWGRSSNRLLTNNNEFQQKVNLLKVKVKVKEVKVKEVKAAK